MSVKSFEMRWMKIATNTKCGKLRKRESWASMIGRERERGRENLEYLIQSFQIVWGRSRIMGKKLMYSHWVKCSQISIVVAGCHAFLVRFETKKTLTLCYLVSCVYQYLHAVVQLFACGMDCSVDDSDLWSSGIQIAYMLPKKKTSTRTHTITFSASSRCLSSCIKFG